MSTPLELAHELIRSGVYESYYADLDTTFLVASDDRRASISQYDNGFFATRSHGPRPRIMHGSYAEALEHLSIE